MPALELITGETTAAGTTFTAIAPHVGNSLTIRNTPDDVDIRMLTAWVHSQADGQLRIRSPRLHDNVQGIRLQHNSALATPLLDPRYAQRLYTQDALTVELTGSGTAGDVDQACLLLHYPNLPGVESRLISPDDLRQRMNALVTIENTLALGTGGDYSGEEALNAEFDLLRANTDYAIIGYLVSAIAACVRYRGVDFGNLGLGGPAEPSRPDITSRWFVWLSESSGLPLIPVFNSSNQAGLLLDGSQNELGVDVTISTILAQLGQGGGGML